MALTETETFGTVVPGFVTDLDGNLAVTTDDSEVRWREGFLRDLDGRLVVAEAEGIMQDGFLRTPGGALCVTTGSVTRQGTKIPGFPTDDDGLICVANDGSPGAGVFPGFRFDGGKLCVTGLGPGPPGFLYAEGFEEGIGGWTDVFESSELAQDTDYFYAGAASLLIESEGPAVSVCSPAFACETVTGGQVVISKAPGSDPWDGPMVVLAETDETGEPVEDGAFIIISIEADLPEDWTVLPIDGSAYEPSSGFSKLVVQSSADPGVSGSVDAVIVEGTS